MTFARSLGCLAVVALLLADSAQSSGGAAVRRTEMSRQALAAFLPKAKLSLADYVKIGYNKAEFASHDKNKAHDHNSQSPDNAFCF